MSTDFRALCAELLQECQYLHDNNRCNKALWDRAYAALAQPEPPLPANYIDPEHQGGNLELLQTFYRACQAEGGTADEIHLRGVRAVLAARPTFQPVPVSKRPWEREDWCDAEGRCWMGDPGDAEFIPSWRLCRPEDAPSMTCSLPYWALPVPTNTTRKEN
jgi:hypothetical protein